MNALHTTVPMFRSKRTRSTVPVSGNMAIYRTHYRTVRKISGIDTLAARKFTLALVFQLEHGSYDLK